MKRILTLTLALLLLGALLCGVSFAEETYVVDNEGLLTQDELARLNEQARQVSDEQQCGVYILTVDSFYGQSAESYTEDYYDNNGLGYNGTNDGILLVVSMSDREYFITSAGLAQTAITAGRLFLLEEAFVDDLSRGDYYEAFANYISQCNYQLAHKDEEITNDYYGGFEQSEEPTAARIATGGVLASILGFLGSLIPTGIMKSKLNNVAKKQTARSYVRDGSLSLSVMNDRYLRTDTSRVRIESDGPRGGYGGGGGTSHVSSGGVSHTGGGGHF